MVPGTKTSNKTKAARKHFDDDDNKCKPALIINPECTSADGSVPFSYCSSRSYLNREKKKKNDFRFELQDQYASSENVSWV